LSGEDEGFLARWSRRKVEARQAPEAPVPAPAETAPTDAPAQAPTGSLASAAPAAEPAPLPPLESLTPHSDFSPFMRAEVDPAIKGEALKKLFSDPALYPMDGLDVYIDDYSKPDPLPEGWLARLNQFANLHAEPAREEASGVSPGAVAADAAPPSAVEASDTSDTPDSTPESNNRGAI